MNLQLCVLKQRVLIEKLANSGFTIRCELIKIRKTKTFKDYCHENINFFLCPTYLFWNSDDSKTGLWM